MSEANQLIHLSSWNEHWADYFRGGYGWYGFTWKFDILENKMLDSGHYLLKMRAIKK